MEEELSKFDMDFICSFLQASEQIGNDKDFLKKHPHADGLALMVHAFPIQALSMLSEENCRKVLEEYKRRSELIAKNAREKEEPARKKIKTRFRNIKAFGIPTMIGLKMRH